MWDEVFNNKVKKKFKFLKYWSINNYVYCKTDNDFVIYWVTLVRSFVDSNLVSAFASVTSAL